MTTIHTSRFDSTYEVLELSREEGRNMLGSLYSRSQIGQSLSRVAVYRFITCWKCGSELDTSSDYFCHISSCGAVQSYKITDVNAFRLFGLEQKYLIDISTLDTQYKNAQKLLHPDKFTGKSENERNASNETSSTVNQAYQILKSPISRAEYLLKVQFDVDVFDEGKTLSVSDSKALMMEVFEVRERIDDMESAADLMGLLSNVRDDIAQIELAFASSVQSGNQARAVHYAIRLKYFNKMVEEIEAKLPK